MRLDLRQVIHVPDATRPFHFQLDLSELESYGARPVPRPVLAEGAVTNHAGALVLEGVATSLLELRCDRCGRAFSRDQTVPFEFLLAQTLENPEEQDDILLLDGNELDLDEVVSTTFILALDTKNLCSDDCKGLCTSCGADLNRGPCGCRPEVDPRLAALAQLLDDVTE